MAEKMRVHILAKELGVSSKAITTKCQAEGLEVKGHMSTLTAGLAATIREWFSEGAHATTVETSSRVDLEKVRAKARKSRKKTTKKTTEAAESESSAAQAAAETTTDVATEAPTPPSGSDAAADVAASTAIEAVEAAPAAAEATAPAADTSAPTGPAEAAATTAPAEPTDTPVQESPSEPEPIVPAGPQNVPQPAQLKGPRVVRYEAPDETAAPRPGRRRSLSDLGPNFQPNLGTSSTSSSSTPTERRSPERPKGTETPARKTRSGRRFSSADLAAEKLREWRDRDLAERQERISGATGRRIGRHRVAEGGHRGADHTTPERKSEATVHEPIMMKEFCSAVGISMIHVLPILKREFGITANINSELSAEMAELIALEQGITLNVVPARTPLDAIREEYEANPPKQVKPRPPVVAFLGHVDHGKTSLLDAIRATHVANKEDGGITQHIGAYHLEHPTAGHVTFLDTPGHAAFTAMRARGAKLTDIVVLVVAADDGVMPQTIEAINHAKAAQAPVVVALNKCDLGDQNFNKIYGQLAEHGLTPSGDWGGDVDVIPTSATTSEGIDNLIEHLAALGEILDLRAGYKGGAMGVVIEAETKEGVGSVVRVMVQQGELKTGAILVCVNAFGKVRALIDDRGKRIKSADPSIPVEVWGLDEVPMAGDEFYQVKNMHVAKNAAEDMRRRRAAEGRSETRKVRTLEEAFKQRELGELPELNVILKADVDGSLDALRTMLQQLPGDEVRLAIRHDGVGAVTDSDILLADASDAIVIAFRVAPSPGAKKLAEEKGVDVRSYRVIYEVLEEIRSAMEGLLDPEEKEESRGSAEVRDVFKISKLGPVAGCLITSGLASRNHHARLIRDGVVVREGCIIESLRRFKEDVKEVRAGLECGIRLKGFDDVKPGDVIELYEVVKHARKLAVS